MFASITSKRKVFNNLLDNPYSESILESTIFFELRLNL